MADKQPSVTRSVENVPAFRAAPKNPTGVETKSIHMTERWNGTDAYQLATVISPAMELGMPKITAEQLVNKMLVEGRADAGTNQYNYNNPRAKKLYETLTSRGYDVTAATFAAAVLDTQQQAKRLGKSFEEIWNGTGKSAATKRTGAQHAQRYEEHKGAATAPKNAQFLDYVKRAIGGNLTPAEHIVEMLPQMEETRSRTDLKSPYSAMAWNYNYKNSQEEAIMNQLSAAAKQPGGTFAPDRVISEAVLNNYRATQGLEPRDENSRMSASDKTLSAILSTLPAFQTMAQRLTSKE